MKPARTGQTATLLQYGQVVVGGGRGTGSLAIYWANTGKFADWQAMGIPISSAVTLSDRVLFTGDPQQLYCAWPASQSPCQ
jgi:hypothetical protein